MSRECFSFVVWLIHELSHVWDMSPGSVYAILKKSGCLSGYLSPNYDVLHTMGSRALIGDVEEYVRSRGYLA